jgi:hypothetical protein
MNTVSEETLELPPPTPDGEQVGQHPLVRRLILRWHQQSKDNAHHTEMTATENKIREAMPENPTGSLLAWRRWMDWEERDHRKQPDPGLHVAMTLAAYSEWCARTEEFGNIGEFEGVPRLVISFA